MSFSTSASQAFANNANNASARDEQEQHTADVAAVAAAAGAAAAMAAAGEPYKPLEGGYLEAALKELNNQAGMEDLTQLMNMRAKVLRDHESRIHNLELKNGTAKPEPFSMSDNFTLENVALGGVAVVGATALAMGTFALGHVIGAMFADDATV